MNIRELAGVHVDEYELVNIIGEGGMSAVYRGFQVELERYVAIKLLSSQLALEPDYIARFNREAKMSASLEHPHIVPVYDYGVHEGMSYVVMRLLNNTLGDRLRAGGMTTNDLILMLDAMAQALDYAHSKGIIHRDVKPNNIMFDERGTPYLVDFGIAKAMQGDMGLTSEQVVLGTPSFMPPEQWRDDPLTPAADQYALAVVIFQALTGQLPFKADNPSQLMYKHLNEAPPLASLINPALSSQVSTVLQRAMSKEPKKRYPLVSNFANALKQALTVAPSRATEEHLAVPEPTPQPVYVTPQPPVRQVAPPTHLNQPQVQRPLPRPVKQPTKRANNTVAMQVAKGGVIGIAVIIGLVILSLIVALVIFAPKAPASPTQPDNAVVQETNIAPESSVVESTPLIVLTQRNPVVTPNVAFVGLDASKVTEIQTLFSQGNIPVRDAVISPNGIAIASAHGDGIIRLWRDGASNRPLILSGHTDVASVVAFNGDGSLLASGGRDMTIRIWDVAQGIQIAVLTGHTNAIRDLVFSPDGSMIASGAEDGTVRVWDVATGQQRLTLTADAVRVLAVAFSPDGTEIASSGYNQRVRFWRVSDGQMTREFLNGHTEEIRSIAYNPAGNILASSSTDNQIVLWQISDGTIIHRMNGLLDIFVVAFNPDGTLLVSGGRDNHIRLWDTTTGQQLADLAGHGGWILGLAFLPDGSGFVSGSGDGSVRLWRVNE